MARAHQRQEPAHERASLARQDLRAREERVKEIQQRYAKFGDRVLQTIMRAVSNEGDLRRLVHRVTGRVVTDPERQHEVLLEYLSRHGESVFLREATPPSKAPPPGADRGPRTLLNSTPAGVAASAPTPTHAAAPSGRRIRLPSGEIIADRRSGRERRTGKDRRTQVELIYKNRRHGRDRRSGKDRRQRPAQTVD